MERCFSIIGAGLGTTALLTSEARQAILSADAVLTTSTRLSFDSLRPDIKACTYQELAQQALQVPGNQIALLVSGDVSFFSAASALREQLAPYGKVQLLCGISSLQYFCAKIGIRYEEITVRSLHGRTGSLLGAVSYHQRVFALTGGEKNAQMLCRELADAGLGNIQVHLGENLGMQGERIETNSAQYFAEKPCKDLAVLLLENHKAVNAALPVFDKELTRAKVPMTKEEVRWVSVAKLRIQPKDIVWDIGAGTGAVTLELARHASDGLVYAVERNDEAIALLRHNREQLGGYNIKLAAGAAPEILMDLPTPDTVFIGGSGGEMEEILSIILEKNPKVRLVINAIALETLQAARNALYKFHFKNIEVVQLSTARGRTAGAYTMMTANNPVFILSGDGYAS